MLKYLFAFFLLFMLILCIPYLSHAQQYTEPDEYYQNIPKLKDCQEIVIDERFISGKLSKKTICFWEVKVASGVMTFWKEIGKDHYGFCEK